MLGDDRCVEAAAHVEPCCKAHQSRCDCGDEIIEDLVCDGLVEGTLIAKRPDVQF